MVPVHTSDIPYDPVEMLDGNLERVWQGLCRSFEVTANLPDLQTLFHGAITLPPDQAAGAVLANMLLEIMESVGRFSPWYRMSARAFGLTSMRNCATGQIHWLLAPEAAQKWQAPLAELAVAIEKNSGLIQAMLLVEGLLDQEDEDPCIVATCNCLPPRQIRLQRTIYENANLVCNLCLQPFTSPIKG